MKGLIIPNLVFADAGREMEHAGSGGAEATALLVAGPDRIVRRAIFPDQRAGRYPSCWVRVTERGKSELAADLGHDESYVSRIHSHPGEAFHSSTDDQNPALMFEGAISIVVPFFGLGARSGIDECAVLIRRNRQWHALSPGRYRDQVIRVDA